MNPVFIFSTVSTYCDTSYHLSDALISSLAADCFALADSKLCVMTSSLLFNITMGIKELTIK